MDALADGDLVKSAFLHVPFQDNVHARMEKQPPVLDQHFFAGLPGEPVRLGLAEKNHRGRKPALGRERQIRLVNEAEQSFTFDDIGLAMWNLQTKARELAMTLDHPAQQAWGHEDYARLHSFEELL